MGKVLSPEEVARYRGAADRECAARQTVAALSDPTADDLLALTEQALDDAGDALALSEAQRSALKTALRARLTGALVPPTADCDTGRTDEPG